MSEFSSPITDQDSKPDNPSRDVLNRVRSGDADAEQELVERFGRGLNLMLRRLTGNPTLADDLYQETLALVLAKARNGDIHNPDALPSFIQAIGRNLFIADRRKEKRYTELDPDTERAAVDEGAQLRHLMRDEEAEQVRCLLGELRFARDRELLIRYYLGDEPKHEICRDLDIDPNRFNRVLFRARQRLRELWERSEKRQKYSAQMLLFFGTIMGFATLK